MAERLRISSELNCSVILAGSAVEGESARNLARFHFERRCLAFSMERHFDLGH